MSAAHLENALLERKNALDDRASRWRSVMMFVILYSVLVLIRTLASLKDINTSNLPIILASLGNCIIMVVFGFLVYHFVYSEVNRLEIEPLPDELGTEVNSLLTPLRSAMNIADSPIQLHLVPQDLTAFPSVSTTGERIELLLPLGFFKVLSSDPESARALLAHEMGHAVYQDWRLFLTTGALSHYLKRFLIPLTLGLLLFVFAVVRFMGANSDRLLNTHGTYAPITTYSIEICATLIVQIFFLSIVFLMSWSYRLESERLADGVACLYASPDGVVSYLSMAEDTGKLKFFPDHPSVRERREKVEYWRKFLERP